MKESYNTDVNIIGSIPDYHLIVKALPLLYEEDEMLNQILVVENEFNLRTEKSRKRFLSALHSAFVHEEAAINQFVGQLLAAPEVESDTKHLLLFWLFSLNNRLFFELNRDIFFNYYYQGRLQLPAEDVRAYLSELIHNNEALKGRWSNSTIKTIASKYLTILKKLQLLEGKQKKQFCYTHLRDETLLCFVQLYTLLGEASENFFEHPLAPFMFSSEDGRLDRLKKLGIKDWIEMRHTGTDLRIKAALTTKEILHELSKRA